jgi:hypothetical protein
MYHHPYKLPGEVSYCAVRKLFNYNIVEMPGDGPLPSINGKTTPDIPVDVVFGP